jgi:hypothetical protein
LKESFFGYKVQVKTDLGLVRAVETTPASIYDGRVNLLESGEWCTGVGGTSGCGAA